MQQRFMIRKFIFMRIVKAILSSKNKERANARKSELLEDSQVITFALYWDYLESFSTL